MLMRSNSLKPVPAALAALAVGLFLCGTVAFAVTDPLSDAQGFLKQGQSAAALEKVDVYIASKPRDPQGPFLKGLILMEMGSPSEALAVFSKLNEDYPELPEPYNNLAVLYARQKQYERARVTLEMAIRADPGYAIARENLGDVYARLASESYGDALQLDPASKMTQSKLSRLREVPLTSTSVAVNRPAMTTPALTDSNRRATSAVGEPTRVAAAPATTTKTPASRTAAATTLPEQSAREPEKAAGSLAATTSTTDAIVETVLLQTQQRGVDGGGWDLVFSPYTLHYNPDDDHKPVVMLGLTKALEGRWLAGGVVFSNSFGQPSVYVYAGQRYVNPFGFEDWYLQWTAGLLYGYVGEYEDKVPLNYKGFSPGFVPSIGYRFNKYVYGELDFLGAAALMFTVVAPLPKDWP